MRMGANNVLNVASTLSTNGMKSLKAVTDQWNEVVKSCDRRVPSR